MNPNSPDLAHTASIASPWRILAASAQGSSHEKAGLPCQDACRWDTLPDGTLLIAVADGAGSVPLSHAGSALAVERSVEALAQELSGRSPAGPADWEPLLRASLTSARAALEDEAARRDVALRDLSTTLILLAARPGLLAGIHIGDGAVVADGSDPGESDVSGDGGWETVLAPCNGEHFNEATFLTAPRAVEMARLVVRHGPWRHLAVFTDGLEMVALRMPQANPHPPFFLPLFRFLDGAEDRAEAEGILGAFLSGPRLRARVDDDVTLVLAAPAVSPETPVPAGAGEPDAPEGEPLIS